MFESIRRILLIKLRAIGDVLLATPAIENLRRSYPEGHIAFLTEPSSEAVVDENPYLDEVIILDRARWQRLPFRTRIREQIAFYRSLRARRFELVIDLFGNPRSAFLTALSGAPHRVGFAFRGRRYLYNTVVRPRGGDVHEVEFNLDALRALGIPVRPCPPRFPLSVPVRRAARQWLEARGVSPETPLAALNPGGGWATKRWRPAGFAAVADALIREYGARVLLLWGPGERPLVEGVEDAMRETPLLLPETTLKEMAAFVSCCRIMVSNDSGPMHIAAALGVPTVGIFGPTNPRLQGPYGEGHHIVRKEGLDCLGCNLVACRIGHLCMETLTAGEVRRGAAACFARIVS